MDADSSAEIRVGSICDRIDACRVCGGALTSVLDLGRQALSGVFPKMDDPAVSVEPLELVHCADCSLLQLAHRIDPKLLYGETYGYRSGLNRSMVEHLGSTTRRLASSVGLDAGDVVLDIGANDGSLLKSYPVDGLTRIGIDPTIAKFGSFYPDDIIKVASFFDASVFREVAGGESARVVTSIAMFYDLEDPVAFARNVRDVLRPDGVWYFEQSYMPKMLRMNSYDTVCHEHVSYYSMMSILRILTMAGLRPIDVAFNSINGGSFAVTAVRDESEMEANAPLIDWVLEQEQRLGIADVAPIRAFADRVAEHRQMLRSLLASLVDDGQRVLGYGASTKGNVILNYCGIGPDQIPAIADVNPDKFGRVTPGARIDIVSESDARAMNPDYYLVLPWHFREFILDREREFREGGGRLIFPMPEVEIV